MLYSGHFPFDEIEEGDNERHGNPVNSLNISGISFRSKALFQVFLYSAVFSILSICWWIYLACAQDGVRDRNPEKLFNAYRTP